VCTSADPRDRRLRVSAYVVAHTDAGPVHLVVDTGPDFRQQALAGGVARVDAVLYTHAHFDHVVGADDLRPFLFDNRTPIPCYADAASAAALRRMLGYIFADGSYPGVARLGLHEVAPDAPFVVRSRYVPEAAVEVTPVPALHGDLPVLGFRVGALAYLTDVSAVPEASVELLGGLDVLVLDGLRLEPHPTHLSIPEAVELARRIGARRTYLVHMTHSVLHAEVEAALPPEVRLGYDGLTLEVKSEGR
jgi:phosphoribosyl 1,2-cyclic phosphate phosphodiesterase